MVIKIKLLTNLFLELTKIMCANGIWLVAGGDYTPTASAGTNVTKII
jgi:hypothetical protein